jgi:uncharacterized protein
MEKEPTYSAFRGTDLFAAGTRAKVLCALKALFDQDKGALVLTFDDQTGKQVDFDLRGMLEDVLARYESTPIRVGPGRPKLGVVAREVSLLPRHWEWLEQQPSGASEAIRKLVEEARKQNPDEQSSRMAIEAAGRFMSAMGGNLAGFEEASRALYARNRSQLENLISPWPRDIRLHVQHLIQDAF